MIVVYDRMWLTNVVSQEHLGARTEPNRERTDSVRGEIRTYAGGRQRAVGSVGASSGWRFTLVQLGLTEVNVLRTWMESGVTVFAKDHRGQSMYGTFFEVLSAETGYLLYSAAITLQHVDVVEGV